MAATEMAGQAVLVPTGMVVNLEKAMAETVVVVVPVECLDLDVAQVVVGAVAALP